MTTKNVKIFSTNLMAFLVLCAVVIMPFGAVQTAYAQTQIKLAKNKYKVQDDVKLGREAATEIEKQLPIMNDAAATRYVQSVGQRLVAAIPQQYRVPDFNYTFKIVNARDINAFALPGGPMYVNRGMIEAAKNEGEMAGVMAHEISHVALRHGTAQATKASNPWNQVLGIGAIIGGGILLGETGAQLGAAAFSSYFLKFSRDAETQSDTLGAQIMANAGYDPHDLANMFKTIEQQSGGGGGGGGVDWFSSHPNPANRYRNIEREAGLLRVTGDPIKSTPTFEQTKRRFQSMPRAQSMAEIEKQGKAQSNTPSPTASGTYKTTIPVPATRYKVYKSGDFLSVSVPNNWDQMNEQDGNTVYFSPSGAYGKDGITHGALLGIFTPQNANNLSQAHEEYVNSIMSGNAYLRRQGSSFASNMAGRAGMATRLSGTSNITNRAESVTIYSVRLSNGSLLYIAAVSPQTEANAYNAAFNRMRTSLVITDR